MNFSYEEFSNKSFSGTFQLLIVFIAQITSCSNYNKSGFSSFNYRSSSNPTASALTFTVSQMCLQADTEHQLQLQSADFVSKEPIPSVTIGPFYLVGQFTFDNTYYMPFLIYLLL